MSADDPDVFVSYTSQDRAAAEEVYRSLIHNGFRCWMAPYDITPGEKYPRAIVRAISSVQVFVQGIVTARSDIYSLGITFCLLFFPRAAQTVDEVGFIFRDFGPGRDLKSILDPRPEDNARPSQRIFGGPQTLPVRNLIGRMIADDEHRRPPTMRAVVDELAQMEGAPAT